MYEVIHWQICFVLSELNSVARHTSSRSWDRNPVNSNANPSFYTLSHEETVRMQRILNAYESQLLLFTYIRLTATESSIHIWRA